MRQLSYKKMKDLGFCPNCGKANDEAETVLCPDCSERKYTIRKENSAYYKEIGICVRCHSRQAEPNKALCYECADSEVRVYTEKDRERKRLVRNERLKQGLCPKCGKEPSVNNGLGVKCRAYLKRYRERTRTEIPRSEWVSYGKCYCCGSPAVLAGKKVCAACYETRMRTMQSCWDNMNTDYWKSTNTIKRKERTNEN